MVYLTRLDNSEILINALLIERIERTPDTVITLTTGKKVMVRETPEDVVNKSVDYLRSLRGADGSVANIAQLGRVTT